ncbi:hypothetical protein [Blastococcus goldschmidtiae]|uniref:Integral membrane protein n=1 Tax=Blastococcus goldschmidtiae TaxID=3075546 RepID=A0ABU2KE26_9ACTN|nr:hypothetical protein [Blastococcus sp. DSM 46792]MDT0278412.1 hypothetical protein [Blastococcus sp. DSM 46792]
MTDGTRAPTREIGDDATAEVAERAREELRVTALALPPLLGGVVLLGFDPAGWSAGAWVTAAGVGLCVGLLCWLLSRSAAVRRRRAARLLSEYAVVHHVDPGQGRRVPADRQAREMARGWIWIAVFPLLLAPQLARTSWEDLGTSVPGTVLLVAGCGVILADRLRSVRAGRRWLADPPGPPRD